MVMRFLNVAVIGALVLAAAYVYDIKYQSTLRAERVAKLQHDLRRERDAIASLRAEWARLGNPRRIQMLANRHLSLVPVKSNQFVAFENLPERPLPMIQPAGQDPIAAAIEDFAGATGSVAAPTATAGGKP
jgi:cell division protein FtsL